MTGQLSLEQLGYTTPTLSPAYDIPEPRQGGRPWEPYKIQPISVTGTIKSVKTDPSLPWGRREIRKGGNHLVLHEVAQAVQRMVVVGALETAMQRRQVVDSTGSLTFQEACS